MIKKLDKLIIKAFIGPFIATFFITLFVLVMQFFWLYIDDLVGKGLDFFTIAKFIGYVASTLVPLALPLAMLLSSIMTFGNLGESFELVAVKSAGIPLIRFMLPLLTITVLICGLAFWFANNVIPVAQLKMNTLLYDITVTKPAFDIKEGIFYDKIDGYTIKVGKKDDDGSTIHNVVIFEHGYGLQDNVIIADRGKMSVSPDRNFLYFDLENGCRYQEKGERFEQNTDYVRLGFKEYKKVFDLSSFKLNKTSDSTFRTYYRMLSVQQLSEVIDSLRKDNLKLKKTEMDNEKPYLNIFNLSSADWAKIQSKKTAKSRFTEIIPDSLRQKINDIAINNINTVRNRIYTASSEYLAKRNQLHLHQLELHKKFALSFACMVLFFIGAPLGSIIRKGGIGMPLVLAVIFFIFFHLLNTFGEKFVKQDVMPPFGGMWLSTIILIPVGLFLTYKAMQDSQLFNKEFYYRLFKYFKKSAAKSA